MTTSELKNLQVGDIVAHKVLDLTVTVTGNYGDHITAMRTCDITNPDEWNLVSQVSRRHNQPGTDPLYSVVQGVKVLPLPSAKKPVEPKPPKDLVTQPMPGVIEFCENAPVHLEELNIDTYHRQQNPGRLLPGECREVIRAYNEGGCNSTAVDLLSLLAWLVKNRRELLDKVLRGVPSEAGVPIPAVQPAGDKPRDHVPMAGVYEFCERLPMYLTETVLSNDQVAELPGSQLQPGERRTVIRAFNAAGYNGVDIDLISLLDWLARNRYVLLRQAMARHPRSIAETLAECRKWRKWRLTDLETEELLK